MSNRRNQTAEERVIAGLEEIKQAWLQKQRGNIALLQRVVNALTWMVEDMKMRFDQTGIGGHYSPELTEAMNLLEELKIMVGVTE